MSDKIYSLNEISISNQNLKALASKHVAIFKVRVERAKTGAPGYRLKECEYYLDLWTQIQDLNDKEMSPEQWNEVADAYEEGSFDHLFERS